MKYNLTIAAVFMAMFMVFGSTAAAQTKTARATSVRKPTASKTVAPATVIRNLYAAHNAQRGPFFQTKSRALVDKFFTKDFADLIWKDRIDAGNEAGYIDFDPLFAAQDVRIKNFKIGAPEPGEGNMKLTDVPVSFKNMGKSQLILFRLLQDAERVWRISDIYYPDNDANIPSLKEHLKEFVGK